MTLKGLQDIEKSGSTGTVYYDEEAGVVKVDTKQQQQKQQLLVDQLNIMTSQ
jgi:hypothetical protein